MALKRGLFPSMEITPKRLQIIKEEEDEDRICDLEACLLIDIISRLPTTKEAIRTGTLSKRWQHLWPHVPNLIFIKDDNHNDDDDDDDDDDDGFYSFVDKTLAQCRHSNLNKFELHVQFNDSWFEPRTASWIRYAIEHNVQDLDLRLGNKFCEIKLDESFFTLSCFTRLRLKGCEFNPAGEISWRNLKSFFIFYAELDDELIQNILSGSPLLETLVLECCYGFMRVDIISRSVEKFVFSGYEGDTKHVIEINAPYIVSLTIADLLVLSKSLLLNVSALVKAELYYMKGGHAETKHEEEEEMLKGLLLNLSHVKELKIGNSCRKALSRLEAKGFTLPSNMKYPDITLPIFWK